MVDCYWLLFVRKKKSNLSCGFKLESMMWVPVCSTGKVSDGWIRDLGFNLRLHQKPIGVLV